LEPKRKDSRLPEEISEQPEHTTTEKEGGSIFNFPVGMEVKSTSEDRKAYIIDIR